MANQQDYITRMTPYAQRASSATGIPAGVIVAQWAHETGWGTSRLAREANNHGGINYSANSIASGKDNAFAKYSSLDQFTADYIRVMNLSYYKDVRSAGSVDGAITALGKSPYAESHYADSSGPGGMIREIVKGYNLGQVSGGTGSSGELDDHTKKLIAIGAMVLGVVAIMHD